MMAQWFRKPTAKSPHSPLCKGGLGGILLLLALVLAVACGAAAPATPVPKAAEPAAPAAAPIATAVPRAKPTPTPQPQPVAKAKLQKVAIAVAPLGWDTNYSYMVTTSGLLDKRMVLEWLVGVDRNTGAYIPELAEKWEMAPNGKDWTFKLRKGVPWQGGWGEFTARDVRHSMYLLVWPTSQSSGISTWRQLTGVKKGDADEVVAKKVEEMVEIVDPHTAIIHFRQVMPEALYNLSQNRNLVMESKARWDAVGHEGYGKAIVGTGPFKFTERKEGAHVRYEALKDHWRQAPEYKELEFRWVQESATRLAALLTQEVHLSDIERDVRKEAVARGMRVISSKQPALVHKWFFGGLYWTEPQKLVADLPFLKKEVRQAINKAINRKAIANSLLAGSAVEIPIFYGWHPLDEADWPGVFKPEWYTRFDELYGYDPKKARELLAAAGYPNGFEFTIYLFTQPGLPEMVDIGQAMALDFEKVGLKPKLENLEYSQVREKYRAQTLSGAIWPSRSSHPPNYALESIYSTRGTVHAFQHPGIDKALQDLDRVVDNKERARILREAGDLCYYEFCAIQMFGLKAEIAANPKYIVDYEYPGTMSGYYSHLEYIKTVPQ